MAYIGAQPKKTPVDSSVTTAAIADGAVTTAKLADANVTSAKLAAGAGGIDWSSSIQTSSFTAVAEKGYFVDSSGGAVTVTLPASPSQGDKVVVTDYKGSATATNKIVLGRNGSNIRGDAADYNIISANVSVQVVYSNATEGWVVTSSSSDNAGGGFARYISVGMVLIAGGGGAGCWNNTPSGKAGGSGRCILILPTADYTGTTTGSPTVTTSGSNTIITFLSSGSYTA